MGTFRKHSPFNLWLAALLSTVLLISAAPVVRAHEVTPSIADLTVSDGQLTLSLRLNVEAYVAGVDLDGLEDTNQSDKSDAYDRLRALPPEDLLPLVREFTESWLPALRFEAGGPVVLRLDEARIPPVGNSSLPRATILTITGAMPPGARSLSFYWPKGGGALVLRQHGVEDPFTGYIEGGNPSPQIPLSGGVPPSGTEVFANYIPVGFDHILPKGLDHILFVLGLFFLSTRLRPLIWQVSAFTLAHTVTLALAAMGWVSVPAAIVEPLIAASIVFVAVENILTDGLNRWRPVVVFGFGLLHGLGFASVLAEFGLPVGQFVPALLGFNVGVEIGQLTVIAAAYLSVGLWFGRKPWYRSVIAVPASAMIALVGGWWFIERVFL